MAGRSWLAAGWDTRQEIADCTQMSSYGLGINEIRERALEVGVHIFVQKLELACSGMDVPGGQQTGWGRTPLLWLGVHISGCLGKRQGQESVEADSGYLNYSIDGSKSLLVPRMRAFVPRGSSMIDGWSAATLLYQPAAKADFDGQDTILV